MPGSAPHRAANLLPDTRTNTLCSRGKGRSWTAQTPCCARELPAHDLRPSRVPPDPQREGPRGPHFESTSVAYRRVARFHNASSRSAHLRHHRFPGYRSSRPVVRHVLRVQRPRTPEFVFPSSIQPTNKSVVRVPDQWVSPDLERS